MEQAEGALVLVKAAADITELEFAARQDLYGALMLVDFGKPGGETGGVVVWEWDAGADADEMYQFTWTVPRGRRSPAVVPRLEVERSVSRAQALRRARAMTEHVWYVLDDEGGAGWPVAPPADLDGPVSALALRVARGDVEKLQCLPLNALVAPV